MFPIYSLALILSIHVCAEISFSPAPNSPFKIQTGGHNLVAGDVNADQKPDLFISGGSNLTVLIGSGNGQFTPAPNTPIFFYRTARAK